MNRKKTVSLIVMVMALLAVTVVPALAAKPMFGKLYYDGDVVRTVIPPAASPKEGVDDLYVIMNGAEGQLPVAAVGPGDKEYHGGKWAFNAVTWNVEAYLLTSAADVLAAADVGDITITRDDTKDFKCPIQP